MVRGAGVLRTISLATIGGVALDFTPIDPFRGLIWTAVLNGIISVPIIVVLMLMAVRRDVMGDWSSRGG